MRPFLIQRALFKKNPKKVDDVPKISDFIKTDYMGSAEFEFGALPKSLRRIYEKRDNYQGIIHEKIKDENGQYLCIIADKTKGMLEYLKILKNISNDSCETYLKEPTYLHHHCVSASFCNMKKQVDMWWDINNDLFFSFDLRVIWIIDSVCKSVEYMDNRK